MREARERLVYEVSRRHTRGESIRGIARALHVDRKTVRRILEQLELRRTQGHDVLERERPTSRAPRPSKLDPFVDLIAELIGRYPDIRATRLHEELCERGFDGSYTIVREYLKRSRPRPSKRARVLVDTAPGKQAQVDWSPYRLADGTTVNAFSCVLSWSRCQYLRFSTDTRQPTLWRMMRRAFEYLGGVTGEYVFDSMPGVVDRWELGEPVLNLRAVDFAAHYDFAYHIAPRADGAYKGKVERPFRYVEESLLNARTFRTLEELNDKAAWWLEHRANSRKHGVTGRVPFEMLAEERPRLKALPPAAWDDRELAFRLVDAYGYARFDGNFYRAPSRKIGAWVYVRAGEDVLTLHDNLDASLLGRHQRAARNARQRVPPPAAHNPERRNLAELMRRVEAFGPTAVAFARRLHGHRRYGRLEIARLLALQQDYCAEHLIAAIEHAHRYSAFEAAAVRRVLRARYKKRSFEDQLADRARERVRRSMAAAPVKQRGLEDYSRVLAPSPSLPCASQESDDGEVHNPEPTGPAGTTDP